MASSSVDSRVENKEDYRTSRCTQQPPAISVTNVTGSSVARFAADAFLRRLWVSFVFDERFDWHMKVRVIVGLAVAVQEKHSQQMRRAASVFSNDKRSVEVSHLPEDPNSLMAVFSIPTAAQGDVLDRIEHDSWNCIDDVTGPVVTATSGTLDGRTSRMHRMPR